MTLTYKILLAAAGSIISASVYAQDAQERAQTTDEVSIVSEEEVEAELNEDGGPEMRVTVPPPAPMIMQMPPPSPPAPPSAGTDAPPPRIMTRPTLPPPAPPAPPKVKPDPVTNLIGTTEKLEWFQAPAVFMPGLAEGGSGDVVEGKAFFSAPLAWMFSATLSEDVTIEGAGKSVTLKAGEMLPQVVRRTEKGADARYTMFCTRTRIVQKEANPGLFAKLLTDLVDSGRDDQRCLQDTDDDGKFDLAVILADGAPITKATDITPVAYEKAAFKTIPGTEDRLTLTLNSVGRTEVRVDLGIQQMGQPMMFDTIRSLFHFARRDNRIRYKDADVKTANILGIKVNILEADRKGNMAKIEWEPARKSDWEFVIIPSVVRTTVTYY